MCLEKSRRTTMEMLCVVNTKCCMDHCLRNDKLPTWKAVADALSLMGEREAALKIQTQYCSSSTPTGTCLPHESDLVQLH